MTTTELNLVANRIGTNPIAKAPKLTEGDYAIQKTNDNYSVVYEDGAKWKPLSNVSNINTLPVGCRWLIFNSVLNHKTTKPVTASVNLEFSGIAVKTNLLMHVDSKGYTNIDTKPLKPAEVKAFKSEVIEGEE
jgi:hypothetical protein